MNYYNIGASAERIRSLRKEFGYTQEQFAELLGMERSFLSRIESGKKGCSVDTFARISALFSVSLDYLILGQNQETPLIRDELKHVIAELNSICKKL